MRIKSKRVILSLAILGLSTTLFAINASAHSYQEKIQPVAISSPKGSILDVAYPNAHIIGWRYKSVNGKVYRRQYNYSREKWIGEWELC